MIAVEAAAIDELMIGLPAVREYVAERPTGWDELDALSAESVAEPLPPLAVLPLAAGAAAGGDHTRAIPVAAAWMVLNQAIRVLDDLHDRDRPAGLWAQVGDARAFNLAAGLYTLCHRLLADAPWPDDVHHRVQRVVAAESLRVAAGQDRDLRGTPATLEEYWHTVGEKNGRVFALACAAGAAACAPATEAAIDACGLYGHHLGVVLQLFDDLEGLWEEPGAADLVAGKPSLALLYGLEGDHPRRAAVRAIVESGEAHQRAEELRAVLDEVGARAFAVWAALQEREAALAALAGCPGERGAAALAAYVTAVFADAEEIAGPPP